MQRLLVFCLLVLASSLELLLAYPSASLLPLERQEKSFQQDLAYFLPEEPYTPFRQRQLDTSQLMSHKKRNPYGRSVFSERERLIESHDVSERRRRRGKRPFEPSPQPVPVPGYDTDAAYGTYETHLDPWFPALDVQKKYDAKAFDRDAVDDALKRLAWERLNRRLTRFNEPYPDHDERRLRIKKRAPVRTTTMENKKVLEAILSDDVDGSPQNESNPKIVTGHSKFGKNLTDGQRQGSSKDDAKQNFATGPASAKNRREPKGKQWMPLNSEHTLRSKKSWDEYFGMDKRSPHLSAPKQWHFGRDGDNEEGSMVYDLDDSREVDATENEQELKDYLVQWYFNKMLHHFLPQTDSVEVKEEEKKKSVGFEMNEDIRDEVPFEEVDTRLRKIEDAILLEATHLLEKEAEMNRVNPGPDNNDIQKGIVDHLKAAFSLEKMRDALEEFQDSFDKINFQEGFQQGILEEMVRGPLDSRRPASQVIPSKGEAEDEYGDDKKKKKKSSGAKKISKKMGNVALETPPQPGDTRSDLTNEVAVPVFTPNHQGEQHLPCPVMTEALGFCEELSEDLGEMGRVLARPCVEHMLCYTCDEKPVKCDMVFLQDATALCSEEFRCQAIASAMRSVFLSNHDAFRRRNRELCDIDQCLLKLQGIN